METGVYLRFGVLWPALRVQDDTFSGCFERLKAVYSLNGSVATQKKCDWHLKSIHSSSSLAMKSVVE